MYAVGNPKTKKSFKANAAIGTPANQILFMPGPFAGTAFPCPSGGVVSVEGPHYPQPHRWYATVKIVDGKIAHVS